jgi:predicted permease
MNFSAVIRDLRYAARSLWRAKVFAFVCLVSLGVGMGAFVAFVTFMRAMNAPARQINPNGLVELLVVPSGPLRGKAGADFIEAWSYPDFRALRDANTGLALTGWARASTEVPSDRADQPARQIPTYFVTANYFSTFGVPMARGTAFDPAIDDGPNAPPRVVITWGYWLNFLAKDPDVVGKTIPLGGTSYEVIGVTAEDFLDHFNAINDAGTSSILYMPLERHPRLLADPSVRTNRELDWVHLHGRLQPGITRANADALVASSVAGLAQSFPATNQYKSASVEPYHSRGAANRRATQTTALIFLGLSGTVLLIVCVNISGMMMVRGAARERELSIRQAIGADRRRLVQYLFFEAVWLAAIGGGLSVLVLFGIPAIVARAFNTIVPPEFAFDFTDAAFALTLCTVVSLVLGLLPALRLSRPHLLPSLKDDTGGGGQRVSRVHRVAAAVQVAIAVPFLVLAGALLDRVRTADFGFVTDGLANVRLDAGEITRKHGEGALRSVRAAVANAEGVTSAAVGDGMPIDFTYRTERVGAQGHVDFVDAQVTHVRGGFIDTVGARLLRGRAITDDDGDAGARVAVISAPLAEQLFPDADPLGGELRFVRDEGREESFTVVGVTADFATSQLTTERPQVLLPMGDQTTGSVFLVARGAPGSDQRLAAILTQVCKDFDLTILPSRIGIWDGAVTGGQLFDKSIHDVIAEGIATGVAGGIVLVLASLGVLGVIAFMVTTRTREIAVRMALGASRWRVVAMMLGDVVRLVAPGVAVGLVIGGILIRTLTNVMGTPLTIGPTPLGLVEPLVYAGATAVALLVALIAGFLPARRAASVQPMIAMRSE